MKAKDFLEQEGELTQIVPTPFSVEDVKSSWMQKEAEFEYTGINVDNAQFTPEGTVLTLSQEGKQATVTFSYSDDVGAFASVKSGQGESINLDLTPLNPPVIETSIGKQVDMNFSWMTIEAFEGIVSAANLKPVEIDPTTPPEDMGSVGSGASTKTSELPPGQPAELDAKQVPAPTPRAGIPGESLYSDGKSRFYPGVNEKNLNKIHEEKNVYIECGSCGEYHPIDFVGDCRDDENRFSYDELPTGVQVIDLQDAQDAEEKGLDIEDPEVYKLYTYPKSESKEPLKEVKVSDLNVFAKHQIKIAKDTLKMSDVGAMIMGGMTKEEAREILKKYGLLPKGESLKEQKAKSEKEAIEQAKANAARFGVDFYVNQVSDGLRVERDPIDWRGAGFGNKTLYKVTQNGDVEEYKDEKSLRSDGTSKYHPGLKQEAIHRVTWMKGKDTFVTDVEAGSDKEASKKVKDSVKADKIVSVGKHVKENLKGEHELKIISLHDGKAECSAGDWDFSQTGKVTKDEIQKEFNKHLKNIPESKNLTYFRFAIREGQRIKIPVGKVSIKENKIKVKEQKQHYGNGEEVECPVCYGRGDKDCPRCKGKKTVVLENKTKKATEFLKRFGR